DLCEAMLRDSAFVQEKDCEFLNKRRRRRRQVDPGEEDCVDQPLYTIVDAEKAMPLFRPVPFGQKTEVAPGFQFHYVEAGHMLGPGSVYAEIGGVRLGFSGDVGRPGLPIIRDPEPLPQVDYLIMESTYGDRFHKPLESVAGKLADAVTRTAARGGKIIAPAFAVGRTQQLVLMLNELMKAKKIPSIPIFVDSPLAVDVTAVFRKHTNLYDSETAAFVADGNDAFGFSRLRYVRDVS